MILYACAIYGSLLAIGAIVVVLVNGDVKRERKAEEVERALAGGKRGKRGTVDLVGAYEKSSWVTSSHGKHKSVPQQAPWRRR